jgi:hypothetical protein
MSRAPLTCERCGRKTDAGAWIGFVYIGVECLTREDRETLAESTSVRCPDHRAAGATRCPRGGPALQIFQHR